MSSREIADDLAQQISSGELRAGQSLPSEREIIERYKTTKATAGKAVALLLADGLARTEFGRGTYVQDIPRVKRVRRIPPNGGGSGSSFADEMRKNGLKPETKLVQMEAIGPPIIIAERLNIPNGEQALIRRREMFADGRPIQLAASYIPMSVAGDVSLALPDTGPTGIYERLAKRGHRVARFVEEIESRRPAKDEADFLRISKTQHVLQVTRVAYTAAGQPLEVTINVFPSQLWQITYEWSADE
jgi:GntR family transcriptional regulator